VNPEERTPRGKPWNKWDNNMKIVFTEILRDGVGSNESGLGYSQMSGYCEHSSEFMDYIKCREFFTEAEIFLYSQVRLYCAK
jgi:hypothetical protein